MTAILPSFSAIGNQRPMLEPVPMLHHAHQLALVRVWRDGEAWRYVIDGEPAPESAKLAKLLDDDGEHVIYIDRGNSGEFIRGAVKG